MIRVVVDINVLISALIGPLGFSRQVLAAWEDERIEVMAAEGIIVELDQKLRLPRIRKRLPEPTDNRHSIVQLLQAQARMIVVPRSECHVTTGDPEDDYILATARLGRANYLVTGDRKLLDLEEHGGAKMISPRELVALLQTRADAGG